MKKFVPLVVVCLFALLALSGTASASTLTLAKLAKQVAALQKTVKTQARTIATQSARIAGLSGDLASARSDIVALQQAQTGSVSASDFNALSAKVTADEASIASQGKTLSDAASLLAIAPYVSLNAGIMNGVTGPNIVFQGANVHVRSTTSEADGSGTGNLIVGWDDDPGYKPSGYRSGSNNLVCGLWNSFFSYGGFVAGAQNETSGDFASVSGGYGNKASGYFASVSGGLGNTASEEEASVSGGAYNVANGLEASVSGGACNVASGQYASISGGGGSTGPLGLKVSAMCGWAAGNTASPGTGTAKYSAP